MATNNEGSGAAKDGQAEVSAPLSLIVTIDAVPGMEQAVESALLGVVTRTRDEDGCIQYELHRDPRVSGRFVFYERWASREALDAHDESDHIVALRQALEGKMAKADFLSLDKIEP